MIRPRETSASRLSLRAGRRAGRRAGISLLIVILLISVATALSYAVLRGQGTAVHIQQNDDLRSSARSAAMTGLTFGMHAMHQSDWSGVATSSSRTIGEHEGFTVSYTAGDASLASDDEAYGDYPYRVTVQSTGYAEDPGDATRVARHTVHAVMRLIPRGLSAWPTDWPKMEGYTFYQTAKEVTELDIPCRLSGKLRLQGRLKVAVHYPSSGSPWMYYLYHLNLMRNNGYPDYRPLTGRVYLPSAEQDLTYLSTLVYLLSFTYSYKTAEIAVADWTIPTGLTTYRIYPGGPTYTIPSVPEMLSNVALGPDPLSNPLGLFYRAGNSKIEGLVSIHGTLFCTGTTEISGTPTFLSVDLPELTGSDLDSLDLPCPEVPIRLPVLTTNNLTIKDGSVTNIRGLAAVFGSFLVEKSPATVPFSLVGRLVAAKLTIKERQPWETASWGSYYSQFGTSGATYFPVWMGTQGFNPQPMITIAPDAENVQYHWNNWNNAIYAAGSNDDGGLRWRMLRWNEGTN